MDFSCTERISASEDLTYIKAGFQTVENDHHIERTRLGKEVAPLILGEAKALVVQSLSSFFAVSSGCQSFNLRKSSVCGSALSPATRSQVP